MDLKTTYIGLELKNPIIVGSSGLSKTLDGIRKINDSGAGALILKSMFEEQINSDWHKIEQFVGDSSHAESLDYVRNYSIQHSISEYLDILEEAKKISSIPIIASLNCVSSSEWTDYATKLENSGADALELNIAFVKYDPRMNSEAIENLYIEIIDKVKEKISIPISVKLGPNFSSLAFFAQRMMNHGVKGITLFNRFFQTDIDVNKMELISASPFSSPEEITLPLRWIAALSNLVDVDFSASTGIHDGQGAVKMLIAGAQTVQLCSTLYKNKLSQVDTILTDVENWMKNHGFDSIDAFRGKLSREHSEHPEKFDRLQYIKALTGID